MGARNGDGFAAKDFVTCVLFRAAAYEPNLRTIVLGLKIYLIVLFAFLFCPSYSLLPHFRSSVVFHGGGNGSNVTHPFAVRANIFVEKKTRARRVDRSHVAIKARVLANESR